ncbi:MAPEG family protein [Emcibacter sp.]|uniref:MAPEG family protein n=1 Tax=Emcibacter sp. TaxID=1979954 RepID=UPI003A8CAAF0
MSVFYPMALMAIFTVLYSPILVIGRFKSVRLGDVPSYYYKTLDGAEPPEYVKKPTRHWSNLYEVPVLFYAVCLAILVKGQEDNIFAYMAWGFLGLRLLQAFIHSTYNNVYHRLCVFGTGLAVVLAMWIRLLLMNL